MAEIHSLNSERMKRSDDNSLWSPEECLADAIKDIRDGRLKCNKLVLLTLDTEGGAYNFATYSVDLSCSERVALVNQIERVQRFVGPGAVMASAQK